jgi:hypothetical protein
MEKCLNRYAPGQLYRFLSTPFEFSVASFLYNWNPREFSIPRNHESASVEMLNDAGNKLPVAEAF